MLLMPLAPRESRQFNHLWACLLSGVTDEGRARGFGEADENRTGDINPGLFAKSAKSFVSKECPTPPPWPSLLNLLHTMYDISYNRTVYTILRSTTFDRWLGWLQGPSGGEPHRRQVAGSRGWASRRCEACWRWGVRDENSARAGIQGLLHHARR